MSLIEAVKEQIAFCRKLGVEPVSVTLGHAFFEVFLLSSRAALFFYLKEQYTPTIEGVPVIVDYSPELVFRLNLD